VGAIHALATAGAVGWQFREHILAPPLAGRVQLFDPASKVLGFIRDTPADFLQHFYAPGMVAKAPLVVELLIANVLLGTVLGLVLGAGLRWCPRLQSTTRRALFGLGFLALSALLHLAALAPMVVDPHRPRTVRYYLGKLARRMVTDGPALDLALTAVALGVALWLVHRLTRYGSGPRAAVVPAVLTAAALVIVGSVTARNQEIEAPEAGRVDLAVRPRNVVLVSIDSLRADHLGSYGYDRPTSPRLDQLAAEGVRFSAAYATSPWTLPSHASMLTGRYPLSHGAVVFNRRLSPSTPTLATVLGRAGYMTGGFVSFEFLRRGYGFHIGFDYFDDFTTAGDAKVQEHHRTTGPLLNAQIIPWIEANADRRFFLFVHYFDVHYNYDPPPPYDTMFDQDYVGPDLRRFSRNPAIHPAMPKRHLEHLIALYDGEIRLTDGVVGEVIETLDRLGIGPQTLVVVTADHGDEFFEHGYRGHGTTLYDEVMRIPLLMRWPDGLAAGRVVDTPVSLADLAPTMYELCGVVPPDGIEGQSLVSLLLGQHMPSRPIYGHLYAPKRPIILAMVRHEHEKYVQDLHAPQAALYDLAVDPGEQRSRFHERRGHALTGPLLAWLRQQWQAHRTLPVAERKGNTDDDHIERLRALGYVD
jgi:arylsulfatase A-like enzyme